MLDNSLFLSCSQSESRLKCVKLEIQDDTKICNSIFFSTSMHIFLQPVHCYENLLYLSSINKAKCISTKLSIHVHTFHVVVTII